MRRSRRLSVLSIRPSECRVCRIPEQLLQDLGKPNLTYSLFFFFWERCRVAWCCGDVEMCSVVLNKPLMTHEGTPFLSGTQRVLDDGFCNPFCAYALLFPCFDIGREGLSGLFDCWGRLACHSRYGNNGILR